MADDTPVPEIVRGVHNVIVERGEILLEKIGLMPPVAMSGGVALNIGVVKELEKRLGLELQISDNPQITGALGAAAPRIRAVSFQLPRPFQILRCSTSPTLTRSRLSQLFVRPETNLGHPR